MGLSSIVTSVMALFWSMLLLVLLMFISALFLCQILQPAILEGDMTDERREGIYDFYGTPTRAFWTLFEVTLGGQGSSLFRPLTQSLHWAFSIFSLFYLSFVSFAVISIIQALFLKDTLDQAVNDSEAMIQNQLDAKQKYCQKLGEIFQQADVQ